MAKYIKATVEVTIKVPDSADLVELPDGTFLRIAGKLVTPLDLVWFEREGSEANEAKSLGEVDGDFDAAHLEPVVFSGSIELTSAPEF